MQGFVSCAIARLAMLPHGLDSNITKLLVNLLTNPSVFSYLSIVSCNLVSIKLLLLLLLLSTATGGRYAGAIKLEFC